LLVVDGVVVIVRVVIVMRVMWVVVHLGRLGLVVIDIDADVRLVG